MDRREFILTTGAAAVAASAAPASDAAAAASSSAEFPSPALLGNNRTLRMATPWPLETSGFGVSASRLASRIETASGGRFRILVERVGSSGLAAIMTGEADLYHGTEHHHLGFHRGLAYFAGLPYFSGLEPADLSAWLKVGGGQMLWDSLAADLGVKPLLAGHTGRAPGLWSTRPIDDLADIVGSEMFVLGLARDVLRQIGGEATTVPMAELGAALADGRIRAAELGGALSSLDLGLPQAAKHHMRLGFNTSGTGLTLGLRRALWDGLDAADRALFEACAVEELATSLAETRAHEGALQGVLADRFGVRTESIPGDVMTAISRAADAVVWEAGHGDAVAERINDSYMAFRKAVTGLDAPRPPEGTA